MGSVLSFGTVDLGHARGTLIYRHNAFGGCCVLLRFGGFKKKSFKGAVMQDLMLVCGI